LTPRIARSVAIAPASDLVHEYTGCTNGQWVYSIRQYIPSNFVGRQYFILLNDYVPGSRYNWSVQVYFDAGQNKVRSDFDGAQLALVRGRWVDIRVEINLDADTQNFWYDGKKLYTKSWKNGVSGNGKKNIAAVDLYGNNAGPVYYDDARLTPVTIGLSGLLPLVANPASDDRWYADLPLAATGSTRIVVGFQNNALLRETFVQWVPLNILGLGSNTAMTVRKGDAAKFTAWPAGAGAGTVTVTCNGQSATVDAWTPVIVNFTNAGSFAVTGTWTPASGAPVSQSVTVNVLSGGFPTDPAACLVNVARPWTCTNLPAAAVMDAGDTNKIIVTQQTLTQGRKLTVTTREPYFPRYILARAGQGGPILASQKLEPFTLRAAMDGFFWVAQVYEDGRQLWYDLLTAARLPATVQLQIQVIVGGVTLDDLTLVRWITRANLTPLDEYTIGLIRGPQVTTSSCLSLKAYQNGEYLGEATYY
jgi:hypothetical protein